MGVGVCDSAYRGALFSSGACPPHFIPRASDKDKFCDSCRTCILVPLKHVRRCRVRCDHVVKNGESSYNHSLPTCPVSYDHMLRSERRRCLARKKLEFFLYRIRSVRSATLYPPSLGEAILPTSATLQMSSDLIWLVLSSDGLYSSYSL